MILYKMLSHYTSETYKILSPVLYQQSDAEEGKCSLQSHWSQDSLSGWRRHEGSVCCVDPFINYSFCPIVTLYVVRIRQYSSHETVMSFQY